MYLFHVSRGFCVWVKSTGFLGYFIYEVSALFYFYSFLNWPHPTSPQKYSTYSKSADRAIVVYFIITTIEI